MNFGLLDVVRGVILTGLLLASVDARAEAKTQPVTLVTPVAYGTHLPGLGTPAIDVAKALNDRSDGTLMLDLREPGQGTAPHEILDKVSDGKVDAGFSTAGFWAAKLPAATLFGGFPFGPDARGYLTWFEKGGGRQLYQGMYDQAKLNVHVIPCAFGGGETGGWFAKELSGKADLEGLRMRIFGLGARIVSRLGAVPVLVSGGALPDAFKSGKVDAAELYTPAVDRTLGVQEAAKIIYAPGWHQPETVLELLINKDRWEALDTGQRELIEKTCRETLKRTLAESASLQAAALASLRAKDGVRVLPWPADILEALREAWGQIAKEEGTRDYFFKTVLEDIEKSQSEPPSARDGPKPDAASAGGPLRQGDGGNEQTPAD